MEDLFRNVLESGLYGSVVILAVLVLRLVLNRAPRRLLCLLWLLAGLRLMLPFSIESGFSLQPRLDALPAVSVNVQSEISQEIPISTEGAKPPVSETVENPAAITPNTGEIQISEEELPLKMDWSGIALWIWFLGMATLCVSGLVSYRNLKKQVRQAWVTPDGCWECAGLDTAFVLGFFPPKIYLPVELPEETRRYIVAHEKAHIARGDHWVKLLGYLVLTVHWFNPLVWVGYHLLCRDIEGACDERVIRDMTLQERKAYSGALLSCAGKHRVVSACPVAFGETSVKQRILSVLRYKKPGFWLSLLGIGAVIFVAVCLLTSPGSESVLSRYAIPEGKISDASLFAEQAFTGLSSEEERKELVKILRGAEVYTESAPDSVTESSAYMLLLEVGNEEKMLHFSPDCHYAWLEGESACRVKDPEELTAWFAAVTEGVRGRETSGEPFASVTEPESWLRGISPDAVSSAYIHAQGETIREGNTTSTSASFGYFAARRFDELIDILNGLPDRAVLEKTTHKRIVYGELQNTLGIKGGVYISLTDPVNGLVGVVLLDSRDTVKLLLTDELDKVERNVEYLDNLHCWVIEDEALAAFLRELWADPPVITYLLTQEEVDKQEETPVRVETALKAFQQKDSYQANEWYHGESGSALAQYWQAGENWLRTFRDPKGNEQTAYLKMDGCAFMRTTGRTDSGREPEWTGGFTFENEADFLPWIRSFDWDSVDIRPGIAGLHGIEPISPEDGTYETVTCVITSPFPVYKRTAQAGLLTVAISQEGELAQAELFATYEEIQDEEITEETILAHDKDATRMTVQILNYDREQAEEAVSQAYSAVPQEQREKALAAMYTAQCKAALDAVQTMEYYHMRVSYEFYRGTYKEKQHTADYWYDGENLLRKADTGGTARMILLHNGSIYQSMTDGEPQWDLVKDGTGEPEDVASWVTYYIWNEGAIKFDSAVETEDGLTVWLDVGQSATIEGMYASSYELIFAFDADGNLKSMGLGTENPDGATMIQNIAFKAAQLDEIRAVIQEQFDTIPSDIRG